MRKYIKHISALLLFILNSLLAFSRDLPPPRADSAGEPCMIPGTCSVPIDDYLPFLFLVAMLLGVWFINNMNRQEYSD